jgi:exosortase A-associated hydrolase 1
MLTADRAVVFECDGARLIGIVSEPASAANSIGVVVVVGGPQYRVGSHRQFTLLARHLAGQCVPTFRFDYRGMGDSEGAQRTFEDIDADIRCAIDAFQRSCPAVEAVVLWGLCDGASAAMMYAPSDPRVRGLVLANPWVRSEQTLGAATVKHYYGGRLRSAAFWRKLVTGQVDVLGAVRGVVGSAVKALHKPAPAGGRVIYQDRMLAGWKKTARPTLLLLSGNDLTAQEFVDLTRQDARWAGCVAMAGVQRQELLDADHTFSTARWRHDVETLVVEWTARLARTDLASL